MACKHGQTFFQPDIQWTQDSDNHILRVCLPGFQKDEFKVQVDNRGKLTIRGGRPLGDGKYMCLEQVFDVPKDSQTDKIRGKFEDARLSLFMPKKAEAEAKVAPPAPPAEVCDKKTEAHIQKETPKGIAATPEPAAVHEAKSLADKMKEKQPVQQEKPIPEQKPRSSLVGDDQFEEYKKKAMAWKVRLEEEVEGWVDYGLLETISKNKKTIAIVAAAFSAGFYISRKLRSSG